MEKCPDNYDAFETFENEKAILERLHKRQKLEDVDISSLPFYIGELNEEE
jgi:hypothetical protein